MLKHIVRCLVTAARHPRIASVGVREFRLSATTSYDDMGDLEAYDAGRELAHIVTARRYDEAV